MARSSVNAALNSKLETQNSKLPSGLKSITPAPDFGEVKASLEQIRNAAYRSRDLIGSIRAMVKRMDAIGPHST